MITFFTIPKDYARAADVAQRNAVGSWLAAPKLAGWQTPPQIIIFGAAHGAAGHASELGIEHVAALATNSHGTPLLSHAFAEADRRARHDILCYLNADIILVPQLVAAIGQVSRSMPSNKWLAVARRRTVDVSDLIDFDDPDWPKAFSESALTTLDPPTAIDCFVFPKNSRPLPMPNFVVGRAAWDNWMIYHAWVRGRAVVDLTPCAHLIHQRHDYAHLGRARDYDDAPDADHNRNLLENPFRAFTIDDATHRLDPDGVVRRKHPPRLARRVRMAMAIHPALIWPLRALAFPLLAADVIREQLLSRSAVSPSDSPDAPAQPR